MDFGEMKTSTPGPSPYQLDLGSTGFNPEAEVDVDVITEDFVWQGDNFNNDYVPPTPVTPPSNVVEVPPVQNITFINPFRTGARVYTLRRWEDHPENWYNNNNNQYIEYYQGDAALIRWQFNWFEGYKSLGFSAIEGYLRGRLFSQTPALPPPGNWPTPTDFERFDFDTNTWIKITNTNNIPIRMTRAPGDRFTGGLSFGFLKIRYNPTVFYPGRNSIGIGFETVDPDGNRTTDAQAIGQPAVIVWQKRP